MFLDTTFQTQALNFWCGGAFVCGCPHVRKAVENGKIQHVAWAYERPNGCRGFGFAGGHFHRNWGHDDFRKVALNAIMWCAKAEVPEGGVPSDKMTDADLDENQDYPKRK